MFSSNSQSTLHNPNKDFEVTSPPTDGISSLAFSPRANHLVAGSWDQHLRCWEVACTTSSGQSIPKAGIKYEAPVLCTSWSADGTKVYAGGCDNKAKLWNLATNQLSQVALHSAPIKSVFWVEEIQALATGSWDKTLKYWDTRQSTPVHSISLPERVYCMDFMYPLAVVGTAERHVIIYDLRKPTVEFKRITSPLKYQSRVLTCFPDKTGFALGSIEGRVAIHHVEDKDATSNFAFKCHREGMEIYSVNAINFHPTFGTFATAGSDGAFNFWDKDSKQRLKQFSRASQPIPCAAFNNDGTIYAYAVSYDWSRGSEFYNPGAQNYILLHPTTEGEIKFRTARPKKR
eukprot:TRINITY_DN5863_c0_g1_i1.p1 TRINITY_DN5863_c0_g1~~TRINITY_DN5863_c0_g1_i1.p1  ORF type:complete len:345 (-),score=62.98 TRINITY_DN5863_c0_g1_i1:37-1071(-)